VSRLVQEIEQCMSGLTGAEGDELTARFLFPAAFVGFQGHFPGRPILPAVCKIQAALAMLEASREREVRLREIVSAKFLSPVTCGEEVLVRCAVAMQEGGQGVVKATVARNGESVAKFRLRVAFEDEKRGCA
jgi:3-hydroxyacyl-[acyl-carrier-protein] dehydratase